MPTSAPVRIVSIAAVPLLGESPKGGWSAEIKREDSIHALIAVHTDAGVIGHGSVFTDGRLVAACTRATINGEGDNEVISQGAAMFCIQVPMFDTTDAIQMVRNSGRRSGSQAEL